MRMEIVAARDGRRRIHQIEEDEGFEILTEVGRAHQARDKTAFRAAGLAEDFTFGELGHRAIGREIA